VIPALAALSLKSKLIAGAVVVVVVGVAGFAAGWSVNGWRLGAENATLEGTVATQKQAITTLQGVNKSCQLGVAGVEAALKGLRDEETARGKAVEAALARVAGAAARIEQGAKDALKRPPAPRGKECETVAKEAADYARKRKGEP